MTSFDASLLEPTRFPLIRGAYRSVSRFDEAVQQLAAGVAAGAIRNAVLAEVKHTLNRAAEDAWDMFVQNRFFSAGRYLSQPEDVVDLHNSISSVGTLHALGQAHRKVSASRCTGPVIEAMREVLAEVEPLLNAMSFLKDKVVKGRAPQESTKPVNPNKVVRTCPCCFRPVAVQRGHMAHHGYHRPGQGWQTRSCEGVRFPPLERSNEGLVWMAEDVERELNAERTRLADKDHVTKLTIKGNTPRSSRELLKGDPEWERAFTRYVSTLESNIQGLQSELHELQQRLISWVATEVVPA